jgi:putative resolvase
MNRFIKIGEAAKILGVSIQTLRRWEETGYLMPARKTNGKTRYYNLDPTFLDPLRSFFELA